jgi:ribosomal protein S12 methylthiotransferase accessory factor
MDKVVVAGTHRVRTPEQTLEIITPRLMDYGITRLADVTGLDSLGVPVVMAVRPLAATLSVAQGKGVTLELAKVSAAMECIEFWHAEEAVPAPGMTGIPAASLGLDYRVSDLEEDASSLITEHTLLDWIEARSAIDDQPAPVPYSAVRISRSPMDWSPGVPGATTNGLASGNTRAEAIVHALYELVERDAIAGLELARSSECTRVDPESVRGWCGDLIDRMRVAGAWLDLVWAPSRFGVPCFAAYLWREDFALPFGGAGAHSDPAVALSRAVTEAAQSRLTAIAGTRDDLTPRLYSRASGAALRPTAPGGAIDWKVITDEPGRSFVTDDAEAAWLARHVAAVTGTAPLVADLCSDDISVVKVLCPGLGRVMRHQIALLGEEAS